MDETGRRLRRPAAGTGGVGRVALVNSRKVLSSPDTRCADHYLLRHIIISGFADLYNGGLIKYSQRKEKQSKFFFLFFFSPYASHAHDR